MSKKKHKAKAKAAAAPQAALLGGGNLWRQSGGYKQNVLPLVTFGGINYSNQLVTADTALRLSAVWACVRLKAETISTLPLKLYRRLSDGTRVIAHELPLYRVLCQEPNRQQTPCKLIEFLVASLELYGNAYFEKVFIGKKLVALRPIEPQNMQAVEQQPNGSFVYRFLRQAELYELRDEQIWHVRGFGLNGLLGLDPVGYGGNVFGGAMSADESAGKVFAGGMSASGFLTHKNGVLKPEQREKLRKSLDAFTGSKNAGKVMVLEAGLEYQGITLNPEAAQLLETRQFSVEEVCRWFRVPPYMIGHLSKTSSWGSSIEGQQLNFLTNTLRPLLVNIEQSIAQSLLAPTERDDYYAEFAVEGLLRGDSAARAEYYASALNNGWMSRDEVRQKENLPPIEGGGGRLYTVQSALIDVNKVGQNYET